MKDNYGIKADLLWVGPVLLALAVYAALGTALVVFAVAR